MKYLARISSFCLLLLLIFNLNAHAKVYINGIDKNYPPFAYVNENGEPDGLDIKAMDWIAKEMGFEVMHKAINWDTIVDTLVEGKIDMICSGMSISPERQLKIRFTDPYYSFAKVFVARSNSNFSVDYVYNNSVKVGVQRGTSEHIFLEQEKIANGYKYRLYFYTSGPLAVESLVNNRIDAVALDIFPAQDAIAKKRPIKIVGNFSDADSFGVGIRKDKADDTLYKLVNEGYKRLQADPYWEELKALYLN